MASRRKRFTKHDPSESEPALYAEFMADLLDGTIAATNVVETRDQSGKLQLDYDEPLEASAARIGPADRSTR